MWFLYILLVCWTIWILSTLAHYGIKALGELPASLREDYRVITASIRAPINWRFIGWTVAWTSLAFTLLVATNGI